MKKLVCYGAGRIGMEMIHFLETHNMKSCVVNMIDKNIHLQNKDDIPL